MIGARFCSTSFRFSSDEDVSARQSEKVFSKTLVSKRDHRKYVVNMGK